MDRSDVHRHASHPKVVSRLKRAEGHLNHVIAMIEEVRSCLDLARQLPAVERVIRNAGQVLILAHIDHCLARKGAADREKPKAIARYF